MDEKTLGVLLGLGAIFFSCIAIATLSPRFLRPPPECLSCPISLPRGRIALRHQRQRQRPVIGFLYQENFKNSPGVIIQPPDQFRVQVVIYAVCLQKFKIFFLDAVCRERTRNLWIEGRFFLFPAHFVSFCSPRASKDFSLNLRLQSLQRWVKCFL